MTVNTNCDSAQGWRQIVASTRLNAAERALLEAAAVDDGTTLATWIREVTVPRARQQLAGTGRDAAGT